MNDLVVLVTGGAGNLGHAVTRRLLEGGAKVAVPFYKTDHPAALDRLAAEYDRHFLSFALDLTTERGAEQAIRHVVEWAGKLSAVAHLVGGYSGGSKIAETPLEVWNRMVNLNMTSAYLITRFALPELVKSGEGSLVFVSSRTALEGGAGSAAYAATKAGLASLARVVAMEYMEDGVRSNVIVPDTIDTPDNRKAMPDADFSRWTSPESIADTIAFLISDQGQALNGASIPVYDPD